MKTKLNLLAATVFLTALATGLGQSPVITTQPQSLTIKLGSTATFTVTATGTEPLAYQWQTDATPPVMLPLPLAGEAAFYRIVGQ